MSQSETPNNVIQFPGRRKEEAPETPKASKTPAAKPPRKKRGSKKTLAGTFLAIALATAAVNKFAFDQNALTTDLASSTQTEENGVRRGLASVERPTWTRNADWEKEIAESLAAPHTRGIASSHVGRAATLDERLRWGILEEKYTITYGRESQEIESIILQDPTVNPSYIIDRQKFWNEYGLLFNREFRSAELKAIEASNDKTIESYTVYGADQKPVSEVRFELDQYKRLLSLKVQSI